MKLGRYSDDTGAPKGALIDAHMALEQKELDEFLYTLADAILAWQQVEHALFGIFKCLLAPHPNPKALSAVFHSVVNLDTRMTMINAAAAVVLKNDPFLVEWEKLSKRVMKAAGRRNALVHFRLVNYMSEDGDLVNQCTFREADTLRLEPSIFDATETPGLQYDVKQITDWRGSFSELWLDLSSFWDRLPLQKSEH